MHAPQDYILTTLWRSWENRKEITTLLKSQFNVSYRIWFYMACNCTWLVLLKQRKPSYFRNSNTNSSRRKKQELAHESNNFEMIIRSGDSRIIIHVVLYIYIDICVYLTSDDWLHQAWTMHNFFFSFFLFLRYRTIDNLINYKNK